MSKEKSIMIIILPFGADILVADTSTLQFRLSSHDTILPVTLSESHILLVTESHAKAAVGSRLDTSTSRRHLDVGRRVMTLLKSNNGTSKRLNVEVD